MKTQFLLMAVLAATGAAAAAPLPNPPDLRLLLQRDRPAAAASAPRHLSEGERAELRRQLGAFSRPVAAPPLAPRRMER